MADQVMPSYSDLRDTYTAMTEVFLYRWNALSPTTRIFMALTIAVGLLYVASKVEQAGWSTILMLSSFGLLAYLFVLGLALVH